VAQTTILLSGHTPGPCAHQINRYTDVTNDATPRLEDFTTVNVFTTVAAFTRGLLDYWNTHGHLPLAIQNTALEEDTPVGLNWMT
jgi:hypothetical protein